MLRTNLLTHSPSNGAQGDRISDTGLESAKPIHNHVERARLHLVSRDDTPSSTALSNRSVTRACQVLRCFQQSDHTLSLAQIAQETGLSKATAYRILTALVSGGMIERRGKNIYAGAIRPMQRRSFRIGYASHSEEFLFSRMVLESIHSSAYEAGIDLVALSNRGSHTVALRNADTFIKERVDLVIEFQRNQESAAAVGEKLNTAGIPTIAIEVPHAGALFYGPNNYRAGLLAGHALAQVCLARWQGKFDELLMLDLPTAGPLFGSRLTGVIAGLRERLPDLSDEKIRYINGRGQFEGSLEAMRKHLRRARTQKVLLAAVNDPSCLGGLTAFEEMGRLGECLAVSHTGTLRARRELRRAGSSLIGAVGYFPERYGETIIRLALDRLQGKQVPPATFIKHHLLSQENVDHFYPNDVFLNDRDGDSLIYSYR